MGTLVRSDGFRLTVSGVSAASLLAGLIFIIRLDMKAESALEKFEKVSSEVIGLRVDMSKDREILNEHSGEIREHRVMIRDLQNRTKTTGNNW